MNKLYRRDFVKVIHVSVLIDADSEQEAESLLLAELMARSSVPGSPRSHAPRVHISEPRALTGEKEVFRSVAETAEEKSRLTSLEVDHSTTRVDVHFRDGWTY